MRGIENLFNEGAQTYDVSRNKLIPCFSKFYSVAIEIIKFNKNESFNVLDLGAGTGLMSHYVLNLFPNAKVTLIDLSASMLSQAEERLNEYTKRIEIIKGDYISHQFEKKYDLIISALSIHHLNDNEKQELFKHIFKSLNDKGQFINADQVLGVNEEIEKAYRQNWLEEVQKRGVSDEELSRALTRMEEDQMSTLGDQLSWLRKFGFQDVNCWFKDYSFAVYSGRK